MDGTSFLAKSSTRWQSSQVPTSQPPSATPFRDSLASTAAVRDSITMTATESVPTFDALRDSLLDLSQPMGKRTRAVFYLRTRGQKEDLQVLLTGMQGR
jgi:hypothetical protein